jgi:hypothetical protein
MVQYTKIYYSTLWSSHDNRGGTLDVTRAHRLTPPPGQAVPTPFSQINTRRPPNLMAAASSDSPGGYDLEFIDDVQKDLECPICLYPLKEPMQTPCGHLFCAGCLDRQSRSGQLTCPLDKRQFPETAVSVYSNSYFTTWGLPSLV